MRYTYQTKGTCSRAIAFDMDENEVITNVEFTGGCNGNLKGIASLVDGMTGSEILARCQGITCGSKPTSCPDQLAQAILAARAKLQA